MIESKQKFIKDYNKVVELANKENGIMFREEREQKNTQYQTVKNFEKDHTQNMIARDSFKAKISEMSLKSAKTLQKSKNDIKNKKKKSSKNIYNLPPSKYQENLEEIEEVENIEEN